MKPVYYSLGALLSSFVLERGYTTAHRRLHMRSQTIKLERLVASQGQLNAEQQTPVLSVAAGN